MILFAFSKGKFHAVYLAALFFLFGFLIATVLFKNNSGLISGAETSKVGNEIGNQAPLFTLADFNGNQVSLSSFQGKPVVIAFWDSSCYGCLEELLVLNKLQQDFPQVVFLGININSPLENTKRAKSIIENNLKITFAQLEDIDGRTTDMYKFGNQIPITFFRDKNGLVANRLSGQLTEDIARNTIQELLNP